MKEKPREQKRVIFTLYLIGSFLFKLDPNKQVRFLQFQIDHLNDVTYVRKVSDLVM